MFAGTLLGLKGWFITFMILIGGVGEIETALEAEKLEWLRLKLFEDAVGCVVLFAGSS